MRTMSPVSLVLIVLLCGACRPQAVAAGRERHGRG